MKNWMLIGHRGVGKSQFLKRLSFEINDSRFLSLDQEIEKKVSQSIQEIFLKEGEDFFRKLEIEVFNEIVDNSGEKSLIVDVGAGFLGQKPKNWGALWVQRATSPKDFLFLNRPKLKRSLKMDETLFLKRQHRYEEMCDLSIELIEGDFHTSDFEKQLISCLVKNTKLNISSNQNRPNLERTQFLTLLNDRHADFHVRNSILRNFSFELRDDLLSPDVLREVLLKFPRSLVSLRDKTKKTNEILTQNSFWDWPLEWGINKESTLLSLHERKDSLSETLENIPETNQLIKLAIEIKDFSELKEAYLWQQERPKQRVFLPRSQEGRWNWFRILTQSQMELSFVRGAKGSSLDQPTLNQLYHFNSSCKYFAALIGSPISHSMTPSFHFDFFKQRSANVLAIDVKESEWKSALDFLTTLGLRWAAVTSPLKNVAGKFVQDQKPLLKSKENKKLDAINTLSYKKGQWVGTNTDAFGFQELMRDIEFSRIAVWGGSGTLTSLSQSLKNSQYYSSRTGKLKIFSDQRTGDQEEFSRESFNEPDVIIWAVGNELFRKEGVFPPLDWKPRIVIDLNYTANSPGIECADNYGCQYRSGMVMFVKQAQKQQEFWQ